MIESQRRSQTTSMDHGNLSTSLRDRHPAWRLLASPHAPLVASFLYRVFVAPNMRVMSEADVVEALEDELFALREQIGADAYPKAAIGLPERLVRAGQGLAAQVLQAGHGRGAVRSDAGHREGNRLVAVVDGAACSSAPSRAC
jgi:hypothetical protein